MEGKIVIPAALSAFTGYIKLAYDTAEQHMSTYGIDPNEFAKVTPLFNAYTSLATLCDNPATATKANRDARKKARKALNAQWRVFLNKEIRLNDAISLAEKEVFGIVPRDDERTKPEPPKEMGEVTVTRTGERQFDAVVEETVTGKKKRPDDATGSNLYSAITEVDAPAPFRNTFHYEGFSSTSHHTLVFPEENLAKRAWVYARYSNQHGQEGPEGPLTSFIIN
jgi:hypothetical protein